MSTNGQGARLQVGQLRVKDFKCIRLVELTPEGQVMKISGHPGQGKTSILDAIEATVRGGDETLVRRGADHTELFLAVGGLAINRQIGADGKQKLAVSQDGRALTPSAGKALLDGIFGLHVFRPIQWVQLSGGDSRGRTERLRTQRDQLLHAIPLRLSETALVEAVQDAGDDALEVLSQMSVKIDLDQQHGLVACEALCKACYDARSAANRQVDDAAARLKGMPTPPHSIPKTPLLQLVQLEREAEQSYQRALGAQKAQAATISRAAALRDSIAAGQAALAGQAVVDEAPIVDEGKQVAAQIAALEERQAALRQQLRGVREHNDSYRRRSQALVNDQQELAQLEQAQGQGLEDPAALQRQLDQARQARQVRELADKYSAAADEVQKQAARAGVLGKLVDLFREVLPQRLLESARFPVPGLGLDGEQLTINGVAIHRLGTADQIRLGVAVAIALHPQAGFVCVDGAESLGSEGLQVLADATQKAGVQLWISEVNENPEPDSIVMRDGEAAYV